MSGRLDGRTVVVTGAARGIGAAICHGLADEGAAVAAVDRDAPGAAEVARSIRAKGGRATHLEADVTDRAAVREALDHVAAEFGRVDAVFNNAGLNVPQRFLDISEDNWELILRVNALGVLIGTQEAAKRFIAQGGGGKIVNTASIAGRQGYPSFAPYSASKAAVISLTQAAARALGEHGITVNAFSPGVVRTPLWERLDQDLTAIGEGDSGFDAMSDSIILRRPAEPTDVVPTAVFLAGPDSDYVTGQVMAIDGGMVLV
jgi:meso-butanediol dehydrogenase/(S,S)-butanediol dehydrogenase/diacetyl reductase